MHCQSTLSAWIAFRSSSMDSLILPGAKSVMDTGTGRHSFHLDLSMVFGDCIYHSHTFSLWPIFPAASLHDAWKFNACDLVLMDLLVSLVSPIDFFGALVCLPVLHDDFQRLFRVFKGLWWGPFWESFYNRGGRIRKIYWNGCLWNYRSPALSHRTGNPFAGCVIRPYWADCNILPWWHTLHYSIRSHELPHSPGTENNDFASRKRMNWATNPWKNHLN